MAEREVDKAVVGGERSANRNAIFPYNCHYSDKVTILKNTTNSRTAGG